MDIYGLFQQLGAIK